MALEAVPLQSIFSSSNFCTLISLDLTIFFFLNPHFTFLSQAQEKHWPLMERGEKIFTVSTSTTKESLSYSK